MSNPKPPKPARPIANFFYTDSGLLEEALVALDKRLGDRCFTSEPVSFDITDYYVREMGAGIMRIFAAWKKLVDPFELVDIKLLTWEIEEKLKAGGKGRPVNIDPGIIAEGHMILATGKSSGHRPYVGRGVSFDLTLVYHEGSYRPQVWTYLDYAGDDIISMMNGLRADYLKDLRNMENAIEPDPSTGGNK